MSYIKTPENAEKYMCESCDFKCNKQSEYNRHILTAKHKRMTNDYDNNYKNAASYTCECGKEYKHRQGLYAHKKKCAKKTPENADISPPPPENRIVHEHISESMVIKCFQTMMAAQAMRDDAQTVRDEAQAEQTRLLIEADASAYRSDKLEGPTMYHEQYHEQPVQLECVSQRGLQECVHVERGD